MGVKDIERQVANVKKDEAFWSQNKARKNGRGFPDAIVACGSGGSNALGAFRPLHRRERY